jgi:hemolysin III
LIQERISNTESQPIAAPPKPLLRGWSHGLAAVGAVCLTIALCWQSRGDLPRLLSMAIYGLALCELYTVSALYHIGAWGHARRRALRALDHANIFVFIAGTYTPLCFNVLSGWLRVALLSVIWLLACVGVWLTLTRPHLPRRIGTALYIGMGWVAIFALPAFLTLLPWMATALLLLGGLLYTIGGIVYARRRPDPFPLIFGYHEVFHLFTIAAGIAFTIVIWAYALPFPRV